MPAASTPAVTNGLQSLIAAGKTPKVAITAVMRKVIVLANALLKAASAPYHTPELRRPPGAAATWAGPYSASPIRAAKGLATVRPGFRAIGKQCIETCAHRSRFT
jgi:hypothetical protein